MLAADLALRSPNDTFLLRQAASCARMCPKYISLPRFPILLGISSLPSSPPISREFCKAFSRRKLIRSSFVKPLTLRFFFSPKEIHPNRRCVWRSCAQLRFLSYFSFSSSSSPRKKKKKENKKLPTKPWCRICSLSITGEVSCWHLPVSPTSPRTPPFGALGGRESFCRDNPEISLAAVAVFTHRFDEGGLEGGGERLAGPKLKDEGTRALG